MAVHQAPPSLGFSRQGHWSGLPFPSPMHESESEVVQSCPTLSDPMDCSPPGSPVYGVFQARVLEWGAIAFSALPLAGGFFLPLAPPGSGDSHPVRHVLECSFQPIPPGSCQEQSGAASNFQISLSSLKASWGVVEGDSGWDRELAWTTGQVSEPALLVVALL